MKYICLGAEPRNAHLQTLTTVLATCVACLIHPSLFYRLSNVR